MKLTEDYASSTQIINGYTENGITINEQFYNNSLIVSNYQLIDHWPVNHIDQLNNATLEPILQLQPEVIIIGTGKQIKFPHPETYAAVINKGIGIEFMDTGAACRTYNVLLSENRKIAMGVILP